MICHRHQNAWSTVDRCTLHPSQSSATVHGLLCSPSFTIFSHCPWPLALSILHNHQPLSMASCAVSCMSLSTPLSHLLRRLPGFLLQPRFDVVSANSSTDAWRASCAGASCGRRLTCPKRASLLSVRPILLATDEFDTAWENRLATVCRQP